jgi:hypothetical protein
LSQVTSIVMILPIYDDDIILMERIPYDRKKKQKILKDLWSSTGMNINIDKMKFMIINSKRITCVNFMYDNNSLEEVTSYKYIGINLHHKFN